jgi:hypothetical protein
MRQQLGLFFAQSHLVYAEREGAPTLESLLQQEAKSGGGDSGGSGGGDERPLLETFSEQLHPLPMPSELADVSSTTVHA